jgi:hypothetical protein
MYYLIMQLNKGNTLSAFQADYRMMVGNVRGSVPDGEFRAFSPFMLWALPIVLLSKAFSLLGCSAVYLVRAMSISSQAESLK